MIEPRVTNQVAERSAETCFRIARPVHQSVDPAVDQSPRAHRAGLECYVHRATDQPPPFQDGGSPANCQQLGMGQRILVDFATVEAGSHQSSLSHHHGSDRYLTQGRRLVRFEERLLHPTLIFIHGHRSAPVATGRRYLSPRTPAGKYGGFDPLYNHLPRPYHCILRAAVGEGFGSCAPGDSEPRQARKGAAIRYSTRVPQIHRNPSPTVAISPSSRRLVPQPFADRRPVRPLRSAGSAAPASDRTDSDSPK